MLNSAESSMKQVSKFCQYFKIYKQNKFHAQLNWAWKKFYNPGARLIVFFTFTKTYVPKLFLWVSATHVFTEN